MLAAIDVGTNTVRLLLGEVVDGRLVPTRYERSISRLGGGFTPEKGLAPEAMERTLFALRGMLASLAGEKVDRLRAVGTQALRQAANGTEYVRRIEAELGLTVEIVAGAEEARLSALGVRHGLLPRPEQCLIFDIGGGSTEFVFCAGDELRFGRSYPLGVVRLAEARGASPSASRGAIDQQLDRLMSDLRGFGLESSLERATLVGTAGTVTTIAAMDLGMVDYDWRRVNNYRVDLPRIEGLLARLTPMSVAEREALPGMEKGRGDLIVPGLTIVSVLLRRLGKTWLTVSDFGLLEGVLLTLA